MQSTHPQGAHKAHGAKYETPEAKKKASKLTKRNKKKLGRC